MKKTLLLLGLTAVVAAPSTGSAKMPLDIPPILATGGGPKNTCTVDADCTTSPNTFCCSGTCKDTACPPPCTVDADCTTSPNTFCCSGTCKDTACPTPQTEWGNDTGITVCAANTPALDEDCDFGRDKTVTDPNPSDGQAGFSFTKITVSGKTCVQDNVTGLTWSPDLGTSNEAGLASIIATSNTNKLCGLTGWRTPTIKELVSIVSYHRITPAIDNNFFTDTANLRYRSSTPNAADATLIWGVHFANGDTQNGLLTDSFYRVRLVRPLP